MILFLIVYNSDPQICLVHPKEGLLKQSYPKTKATARTTEKETSILKPHRPIAILLLQSSKSSSHHERSFKTSRGKKFRQGTTFPLTSSPK